MNARLPEPFRPGDPVTGLRAPLNDLRAAVEHLLKNHIKSGPGIYISEQSGHIIISTERRPQLPQPRSSRGGGRTFVGVLSMADSTPTLAEISSAIISALGGDAPAAGDWCVLLNEPEGSALLQYRFHDAASMVSQHQLDLNITSGGVTRRATGHQLGWLQ